MNETTLIFSNRKILVNCNSWFTSKFEEPFDKLRVNGQGTCRSW